MPALLVGYGTLLYRASLGDSIGADAARLKAVRSVAVPGFRRLFNLRPDHYTPSACLAADGRECAAMNVEPAPRAWFNGVAFEVEDAELAALDLRERYYRRLEAPLVDFASREPLGTGFVYSAEPTARWIERSPDKLLPLWRDVLWARAGAYGLDPEFGRAFDRTTYLADGAVLMVERYRDALARAGDPVGAVRILDPPAS
jgi:hypothetical protein